MRSNRRRDTGPEIQIRRLLHARGLRYRVDVSVPPLGPRSRVDIVFRPIRLAVYVDGCFWHGCPEHATFPKSNADYWLPKLARNVERDLEAVAVLEAGGWHVMRFWEHEDPELVASLITARVEMLRTGPASDTIDP